MTKPVNLDYTTEYPSVDPEYIVADYSETIGKKDGWLAGLLFFALLFGPRFPGPGLLPPIRLADIVIVLLVLSRWAKSIGKGFLFSPANRAFSVFMLLLALFLTFSTLINIAAGRYIFFIKDFYQPIAFIRMALIAAIMASFRFGEKQVKQVVAIILALSVMSIGLAFLQKYAYWHVAGLVERLYTIEWIRLEKKGVGARVVGTFGNSNVFSMSLVMLAITSLAVALNMKRLWRLLATATFIGLGLAIVMTTASRTGILALMMVSGMMLLLSLRGKSRIPALILMVLFVFVFSLTAEYIQQLPVHPRVKELFGGGGLIKTVNEKLHARYVIWEQRVAEVKETPVWGEGMQKRTWQLADNGYIIMLLRVGVIGLALYLFMLLFLLVRGAKALRIEKRPFQRMLLLASFTVLICHMLFEFTGDFFWSINLSAIFAAFMGLLCGLSRQALDEKYYQGEAYYEGVDEEEIAV